VAWLIALPLGIWTATHGGIGTGILNLLLAFFLAIPELLVAMTLLVCAARTGLFPTGGMVSAGFDAMTWSEQFVDIGWHLAAPVLILVAGMLPALVRHVRASVSEAFNSTFALSARALGIPSWRRLFRHVLPVALNPLISLAGVSFGTLLSGSLLIEVVVGWPGLGPLFLEAILARDFAVVIAVVMMASALLMLGNLLADVALYQTDPRIREIT
jgi:peptide/nickel transport system permease protein